MNNKRKDMTYDTSYIKYMILKNLIKKLHFSRYSTQLLTANQSNYYDL